MRFSNRAKVNIKKNIFRKKKIVYLLGEINNTGGSPQGEEGHCKMVRA